MLDSETFLYFFIVLALKGGVSKQSFLSFYYYFCSKNINFTLHCFAFMSLRNSLDFQAIIKPIS